MKKEVICSACDGRGYISRFSHDEKGECTGAYTHTCHTCNGAGKVLKDMTEYDRVMTMDVDELAVFLINFVYTYNNRENQKNEPLSVANVREQLLSKAKY